MPELLDGGTIELLLSELATNAINHARSPFSVVVRYDGQRLRIDVEDSSPLVPLMRTPSSDDTGGRGLLLVDALAAAWGVTPRPDGKRVWFELPVPPVPA